MASATVPTPRTTAPAGSRAWTFEKTSTGPWSGSREPQRDRYWAARNRPTGRNRGPSGRSFGNGTWVKTFTVVLPALPMPAGVVLPCGLIVPPTGAVLQDVPLATPVRTRGRAKKLLRRLQGRFPAATVIECCRAPESRSSGLPSISAPGAPAQWLDMRAPALAPRLSWKQFATTVCASVVSSTTEARHG